MREQDFLKKANVVLVGKGQKITGGVNTGREAIVIGVIKKLPLSALRRQDVVPSKVRGIETDVIEVGRIRLLAAANNRADKWRPAPGGVSIGHRDITAGTLGMLVTRGGEQYILSNNHILANCNQAELGDPIMQPGPFDITPEMDACEIAKLAQFIPIVLAGASSCMVARFIISSLNFLAKTFHRRTRFAAFVEGKNLVDCALAKPNTNRDVVDDILELGKVDGIADPNVGMLVKKSGRSSGLTYGEVIIVDATVKVAMDTFEFAIFCNQFTMGPMSQPGDSGSIIVTRADNKALGLLFAGNDTTTIANRFSDVVSALELDRR